jgi:hypothetical protein
MALNTKIPRTGRAGYRRGVDWYIWYIDANYNGPYYRAPARPGPGQDDAWQNTWHRGMAQSGSASALGAEGRGFESLCPDHFKTARLRGFFVCDPSDYFFFLLSLT